MTLGELLAYMGQRLAAADIPYMVTGSVASSFHGVPRSTRDIDMVVDPTAATLETFLGSLPSDAFYVEPETARAALAERGTSGIGAGNDRHDGGHSFPCGGCGLGGVDLDLT